MADDRLARIEGQLAGMCEHIDGRLDELRDDTTYLRGRVDRLDRVSAQHGAIAGGAVTVGLALIADTLRRQFGI
jgi:hypothetical protein